MRDPLLDNYAVPAGHFDELLEASGEPRGWWASLAAHADLSAAHLTSAQSRVARQMHESGVTYNIYTAADGPNLARCWLQKEPAHKLPNIAKAPLLILTLGGVLSRELRSLHLGLSQAGRRKAFIYSAS